ncbi:MULTISPECIES: hypothetical protein [Pseudomonas]|uniref:hypothetical protein n=1 Tax=Pseudomonas TaxID=286 RepID=UPI0007618E11
MKRDQILPRILRYRDAPGYLGMCKDEFNKTVRPFVAEFPIGTQGVGFDRYELDSWADAYIAAQMIRKEPKLLSNRVVRGHERLATEASSTPFKDALRLITKKK